MKMKVLHKLLALMVLCGVVPLVAVSWLLIGVGRQHVQASVEQVHRLEAGAAASGVAQFLQRCRNRLAMDLEGSIGFMSDEDVQSALVWILTKQDNLITFRILRAHDERGFPITDPVRLPAESIPEEHRRAFLVADGDVAEFARHVPLADAIRSGEPRLSEVYVAGQRNEALVAMAVPIHDRLGQLQAVVTGEVSLREVQRLVSDLTLGRHGYAFLVDGEGRAIAHPEFDRVKALRPMTSVPVVAAALAQQKASTLAFRDEDGVDQLGASAPVFWNGWQLLVQQPAKDAYAPVADMMKRAAYILVVALAASLGLGTLWVRSLVRPLNGVMEGMRRIVDGHFGHRLDVKSGDEVGELAGAFNRMGRMLETYKAEIEGWNVQLQQRVDAKTKQLESAQAQLVQSAKLTALGQLGAGVAHELNTPLAGVVGQAALMKRRLKKLDLPPEEREKLEGYIGLIEGEAGRCRDIVHGLLNFSQAGAAGTDIVDVNGAISKFLVLVQTNLRSAGVVLSSDLAEGLPPIEGNEHQLQQVLMHLTSNAQQAMPDGGTFSFRTRKDGDGVAIEVSDTGRGIAREHLDRVFDPFFTTKDDWKSPGLGLSVCYSILESHGGSIDVQSEQGAGTTFTIHLPKAGRAHPRTTPREHEAEPVGLRRGKSAVGAGA